MESVEPIEPADGGDCGGERLCRGLSFCTLGDEDLSFLDGRAGGAALNAVFGVGLSGIGCTLCRRGSGDRDECGVSGLALDDVPAECLNSSLKLLAGGGGRFVNLGLLLGVELWYVTTSRFDGREPD